MNDAILRVENLKVSYQTLQGKVRAVDGISFSLSPGERFGLVGESGSGKSTTALSLLRLIKPPGNIDGGRIFLDGVDLLALSDEEMRRVRLADLAMIPQGAMNSLNPVATIKNQIIDGMRDHGVKDAKRDLEQRVVDLLDRVGLGPEVANMYPHELSGGMKQRATTAIATSLKPKVIVADEPTSALDVVVQRQVMETLTMLQEELGAAIILIGHDMGLMAQVVDRLGVMYAGKLVEVGTVNEVLLDPHHPYTQLLIESLPSLESKRNRRRRGLRGIPGLTPSLLDLPSGCSFNPRCPKVMEHCPRVAPELTAMKSGRLVACHLYDGDKVADDAAA